MQEDDLRRRIEDVRSGALPRRRFVEVLASMGLSAPMASVLLMNAGVAQAEPFNYKPTKRGGGGTLKVLMWQAPVLLNPHFAAAGKDEEGARVFYEPLARWDAESNLLPVLAAEIPSRENGGLLPDGKTVIWKLKTGVSWHDGQPFTADDVVFNCQYATDPATAAVSVSQYLDMKVEKVDSHTVRVVFSKPTPFWPAGFAVVRLIPRHIFAPYIGARSREAPANLKPVGTGPYKFIDFRPGDLLRGELNPNYHLPNRPYFDAIEIKGGGDSVSAARAVLQSGEYDFASNLQVEDDILKRLEAGGKGRTEFHVGGATEAIHLNASDPNIEVDGERSSPKTQHPFFGDPVLRQAMALLVDRKGIQENIFGRAGVATANWVNNPMRYRSPNQRFEFNIDKANALLDGAGYKRGSDGIREKGGKKLQFVFQSVLNARSQRVQQVVKQAAQKAGIELDLKTVDASVFFSSDVGNRDTYFKFYADMQSYSTPQTRPDPSRKLSCFASWETASKANKWQGLNVDRWRSDEFDKTYKAAEFELDPVKYAALLIRLNDLICNDGYVIPLVARAGVSALAKSLVAPPTIWEGPMGTLHEWYREA
jgi:peptide/nickel transport system substrate-binding protein